jgi:hypothetical protein
MVIYGKQMDRMAKEKRKVNAITVNEFIKELQGISDKEKKVYVSSTTCPHPECKEKGVSVVVEFDDDVIITT